MFKIVDGREHFYQWDMDRQITVADSSIVEVHFCNRTDDCSLVVDVVNGIANVPNIILTNSFDVRVFGYDGKATLHEKTFKVKPRTKPADYVYVETEARKFDELFARAEQAVVTAEESVTQVNTTANELYEYIEDHVLDFVDDGKGNVELTAIDKEDGEITPSALKNYYTKAETDERIEAAVEGIEIPETDLTGYAKLEDIPTVPTNVSAFTNDAGYLTEHQSLDEYAKKSEIPTDYLTSIPEEYITESELTAKGYLTEHQDLSSYAKKSDVPTKVGQLTNDKGYITLAEVPKTDLSDYALKSEIPDVSGFISEIPSEYITETELNAKNYTTKTYVDDAISSIEVSGGDIDTSNLLKFTTVDDQYNWYVPTTNKHQVIQNDMPVEKTDTDLDRVINGKTLNNNTIAVREGLQLRVPVAPTKDNHAASKKYVDDAIANIDIPEGGGGSEGGSGVKILCIPSSASQFTDELKAALWEYINTYVDNGKVAPDDTVLYVQSYNGPSRWLPAVTISAQLSTYGTYVLIRTIDLSDMILFNYTIYFNSNGTFNRIDVNSSNMSQVPTWSTYTGNIVGGDVYSIKEIFIKAYNNNTSDYLTSYMILDTGLGNLTYTNFPTSNPNIHWYFDGYYIAFNDSSVEVTYYAIKE